MDRLPELGYDQVRVVFTDLDGTLYPGMHEDNPLDQKPGLLRNMAAANELEKAGVPVIPATGNNLSLAQAKMVHPGTGDKLRDLSRTPGIYCNGALVKGEGGKRIMVKPLGGFVRSFVQAWTGSDAPGHGKICIVGLTEASCLLLTPCGVVGRETAKRFCDLMMVPPMERCWRDPEAFIAECDEILSMLVMLPETSADPDLIRLQQWLQGQELLQFALVDRKCSGLNPGRVCCKHVHVPGIGPEIDISPVGVNKGSAIAELLTDAKAHLSVEYEGNHQLAVFGDAGNDVELFGMQRSSDGSELVPLGNGFRPEIRVAMPWANDLLLSKDANVQARVDWVFKRILHAQQLPHVCGIHNCSMAQPAECDRMHGTPRCCDNCALL
eukprot:TRINITY_DN16992_c0_g1_i3.p1 TRINITY_DN16992_c0_g1~~TRINITY_DN16992_c0_g1_i3.p1  ORF type:complete len:382 (+),score=84.93 TRINITY_DN16992_c0_g1_i3:199-1344(+)